MSHAWFITGIVNRNTSPKISPVITATIGIVKKFCRLSLLEAMRTPIKAGLIISLRFFVLTEKEGRSYFKGSA